MAWVDAAKGDVRYNLQAAHGKLHEAHIIILKLYAEAMRKYGVDYTAGLVRTTLEDLLDDAKAILADAQELMDILQKFLELKKKELRLMMRQAHKAAYRGSIIIKKVPCGKHCRGCPHGPYAYRVYRENGKLKWKYLGKAYAK